MAKSIVAFVGPIAAGKTTMADYLQSFGYRKLSFANQLREEVANACADGEEEFYEFLAEMKDPQKKHLWRPVLQWWGTDFRRNRFGENYWVDRLRAALPHVDLAVIDDCRFPNEYDMLREEGAFFVRLDRNPNRINDATVELHESERYWEDFAVDAALPWMELKARQRLLDSVLRQYAAAAA